MIRAIFKDENLDIKIKMGLEINRDNTIVTIRGSPHRKGQSSG